MALFLPSVVATAGQHSCFGEIKCDESGVKGWIRSDKSPPKEVGRCYTCKWWYTGANRVFNMEGKVNGK